jgi:hypothetical protein
MKSILLKTLGILIIFSSCDVQIHDYPKEERLSEVADFLYETMHENIAYSASNLDLHFDKDQGQFKILNTSVTAIKLEQKLNASSYENSYVDIAQNARISINDYFSEDQVHVLNQFNIEMQNVTSEEDFYTLIYNYQAKLADAENLSFEEKIVLIGLIEYAHALHESILEGAFSPIINEIRKASGGRISNELCGDENDNCPMEISYCSQNPADCNVTGSNGCTIDWGNVWQDAVIGFGFGFAGGAYTGATAGTVTFPIVGTVTGWVAGGMVGGAVGFTGGATQEIAGQLFFNCIF